MTRIGLLSDVHANLPALQEALRIIDRIGVDEILVAGDLVGYGAQPNQCVEALQEVGARCVAGNHDLFVLDRLPDTRFPPLARRSAEITRRLLSMDAREYLDALPLRWASGNVLMTHGSLDGPEEYVTERARARELLARLPSEAPGADTLVLGHTHTQWCVSVDQESMRARGTVLLSSRGWLVNPGSVGQSRQREPRPRARFAVLDTDARSVKFFRVEYDVEVSREALHRLGLPDRCLHAPPRLRDVARQSTRRAVRRVVGRGRRQ
jgi:putative phosphoesterase